MARSSTRWTIATALVAAFALLAVADQPRAETALPAQTNREGQVTVKVTPQAVAATAPAWRFEVVLDTHSVTLAQDMRAIAHLKDANGAAHAALAWEGDPPGGHHRKGILVFAPIAPMPARLLLTLGPIGAVGERFFVWTVGP